MPANITPVNEFELERYLGQWYEIARLDNSFEAGLSQVTAQYTLRGDGGIDVVNRGYNKETQQWKQVKGKAYFVKDAQTGHLKVSFFGPFYSSYIIFGLDKENYDYAFVSGYNYDYLWLLSRKPQVSHEVRQAFEQKAAELGFEVFKLIDVEQVAEGDA